MKSAKMLHFFEMAVLFLIMICVVWGVQIANHEYSEQQTSTAAESETQVPESETQTEPAPISTTEWLPPIQYDDYVTSAISPENFHSTVVLGNSQAQALANYGLVKNADFVTKVGLSINKVLTSDSGNAPIQKIYGKNYQKAVFIFGENELGWPYPQNFISEYKKVIAKVRELNPGVQIYCQAIFPVSAEYSAKSKSGITNEHVVQFNEMLEEMCEEIDAKFMPVSEAFRDSTGALPEGAATDGVHFNYDYCKIWAGDLSAYLQDGNEANSTPEG